MLLALGACAHRPIESTPARETAAMTTPESVPAPTLRLTAEQALGRLLELVRTTRSVEDFTPAKLQEVFEQELWREGVDRYGFGGRITPNWACGGKVSNRLGLSEGKSRVFDFGFTPIPPGSHQPMTSICEFDFDRFTAELEVMGFSRRVDYGEHGRVMNHTFDRPGMRIEVYPRGEASNPPEKVTHDCVEMVLISDL